VARARQTLAHQRWVGSPQRVPWRRVLRGDIPAVCPCWVRPSEAVSCEEGEGRGLLEERDRDGRRGPVSQ